MNDLSRRLARLKKRTNMASMTDDNLELHIEDATSFFLEYTNRTVDLGESIDALICEMAAMRAETQGMTNMASASEGGISRSMGESIPLAVRSRLDRYRLIPGINTEGR